MRMKNAPRSHYCLNLCFRVLKDHVYLFHSRLTLVATAVATMHYGRTDHWRIRENMRLIDLHHIDALLSQLAKDDIVVATPYSTSRSS